MCRGPGTSRGQKRPRCPGLGADVSRAATGEGPHIAFSSHPERGEEWYVRLAAAKTALGQLGAGPGCGSQAVTAAALSTALRTAHSMHEEHRSSHAHTGSSARSLT